MRSVVLAVMVLGFRNSRGWAQSRLLSFVTEPTMKGIDEGS